MAEIYKVLQIECFLDDENTRMEFEKIIKEKTNYTVPGYQYHYLHYRLNSDIEFEYCFAADDKEQKSLGIDIHFCSNSEMYINIGNPIDANRTAPYYEIQVNKNSQPFAARIICPDVYPTLKGKKKVHCQATIFAESVKQSRCKADKITDLGDGMHSAITGTVKNIVTHEFDLLDERFEFHEIDLEIFSKIFSVVVRCDKTTGSPQEGDRILVEGIVSFDVAMDPASVFDKYHYKDIYDEILPDNGTEYRFGFIPEMENNLEVLQEALNNNDLLPFFTCCRDNMAVIIDNSSKKECAKEELPSVVSEIIGKDKKIERGHITNSENKDMLGLSCLNVITEKSNSVIMIGTDDAGMTNKFVIASGQNHEVGIDHELHCLRVLMDSMNDKAHYDTLEKCVSEKCLYQSEPNKAGYVGFKSILDHLGEISDDFNEKYSYEIVPTTGLIRDTNEIPPVFKGNWCLKEYFGGKDNLEAEIFIRLNEENKMSQIFLSCNGAYLNDFNDKPGNEEKTGQMSAREIIENIYGTKDPLSAMGREAIPEVDENHVYVWKTADQYARDLLKEKEYKVKSSAILDDCIGYVCRRRGQEYAVYMYAYGEEKTKQVDAMHCQYLKNEEMSEGRIILVLYLHVEKHLDEAGNPEYKTGYYLDAEKTPVFWQLCSLGGKEVFLYYPNKEILDLAKSFAAAYNDQDLDRLKAFIKPGTSLSCFDRSGTSLNDGMFSHLAYIHEQYGDMKIAYTSFYDLDYSITPCIPEYGYLSFNADERITNIQFKNIHAPFRDIIYIEDLIDDPKSHIPELETVQYLVGENGIRYSILLHYSTGEVRRYDLEIKEDEGEVVKIADKAFTDKMFSKGRRTEVTPKPEFLGYNRYPERGAGIEWINGFGISEFELYYNSVPVDNFEYSSMESRVFMKQNYIGEDGLGVGKIANLDPQDPLYLFDTKNMIAKKIPVEYKDTPIYVWPIVGGCYDGLVSVSTMGEISLQYHHNKSSSAGMWGWLDTNLNVVIEPKYIFAECFDAGRAIVCKGEWDIDENGLYWCEEEKWGVIDRTEKELVPCRFDELYAIEGTTELFFVHEGGWDNGHYSIYSIVKKDIILKLDFEFDMGYMFNECFVTDNGFLVFDEHLAGEGKDLITIYDLEKGEYCIHQEENTERTYNGKKTLSVKKDGKDIIIF